MKPVKVNDVDLAFGGNLEILLPAMDTIPTEFKEGGNQWNIVFRDWFYKGLTTVKVHEKEGVDVHDAFRHIGAIMVSFSPSHEHKEAGCSYLLSEFFHEIEYETE